MEELISISKVQIVYVNSRLIYILEIPLLTVNTFNLYKLLPVPIPQDIASKKNAYIVPQASYLAITTDRTSYTPLTESQFENVKKVIVSHSYENHL